MLDEKKKTDEKKSPVVVVACPGFNCVLHIGNKALQIDSYHPVNLSELFPASIIKSCKSLQDHINGKTLMYYHGEQLQEDPSASRIDAVKITRVEPVVQFTKSPLAQPSIVAQEDRVARAKQIKKTEIIDDNTPFTPNDTKALTAEELSLPASADVNSQEFAEHQKKSAELRKELIGKK